jgi:hypothetical protein
MKPASMISEYHSQGLGADNLAGLAVQSSPLYCNQVFK